MRRAGCGARLLRSGSVRLCAAAAADHVARELPGDRASLVPRKPGERVKTNRRDALRSPGVGKGSQRVNGHWLPRRWGGLSPRTLLS
jgi:hypothetical protein